MHQMRTGMMDRTLATLPLYVALAAATACGSSTQTNVTAPATVRCQPSVSTPTASFGVGGGTSTVTVTVARECAWTAASDSAWIAITSARQGQGDGSISYRVDSNADPVTRRGAISVNDQSVQLAQDAAPCRFTVSASTTNVPAAGAEVAMAIRTHAACAWTVQAGAPWALPVPPSGRGDATVEVNVAANSGPARTVEIRVEGERLALAQAAATAPGPGNPPPPGPGPNPPAPNPPAPNPPPAPGPTPGRTVSLEGRASSVRGSCPDLEFTLDGRRVTTSGDTQFRAGPCRFLENGVRLRVEGRELSDGTVRADRVEFRRNDDDDS